VAYYISGEPLLKRKPAPLGLNIPKIKMGLSDQTGEKTGKLDPTVKTTAPKTCE